MAFVNERISDEDRLNFDFSHFKRPPLYIDSIEPYNWTIDRERNIVLVWTRGGTEEERNAQHFALQWKGQIVYAKLEREAVGLNANHVTSTWRMKHLTIPPSIEASRNEIIEALKQALTEYKVGGIGVHVASHEAKFEF